MQAWAGRVEFGLWILEFSLCSCLDRDAIHRGQISQEWMGWFDGWVFITAVNRLKWGVLRDSKFSPNRIGLLMSWVFPSRMPKARHAIWFWGNSEIGHHKRPRMHHLVLQSIIDTEMQSKVTDCNHRTRKAKPDLKQRQSSKKQSPFGCGEVIHLRSHWFYFHLDEDVENEPHPCRTQA